MLEAFCSFLASLISSSISSIDMSAMPFEAADARILSIASHARCSLACFSDSTPNGILSCVGVNMVRFMR